MKTVRGTLEGRDGVIGGCEEFQVRQCGGEEERVKLTDREG